MKKPTNLGVIGVTDQQLRDRAKKVAKVAKAQGKSRGFIRQLIHNILRNHEDQNTKP